MALSADTIYAARTAQTGLYPVTNSVVVFAGALLALDNSVGTVKLWADTANFRFLGIALNAVTGNAALTNEVQVNENGIILERVSVTGVTGQTDVGDLVYATDDNTFTKTATLNVNAVGYIVRFHSGTTVDVKLFTPSEYRALVGA